MSVPVAESTSVDPRIRRRAHILERAHAQLSSSNCHLSNQKDGKRRVSQTTVEMSPSCASDSESRWESSFEAPAAVSDRESVCSAPEEQHRKQSLEAQPQITKKLRSRAWYEFDLAVLVALVSPVGQWLTGGDHVKSLSMICLLIYYLHQIIEVPWTIYQNARLQRPLPSIPPTTIEEKYQQMGASELRKIEIFFLCLTALSPVLGAAFLRYASATMIGPEAVSWFNVGLFVLATGVRPWTHLVERLKQRTSDLHEAVQYPIPPNFATTRELLDRLDNLTRKIEKLEKSIRRNEIKTLELRDDVYHDIDEMLERMDTTVRKHEKRQVRHESRVKGVEDTLRRIENRSPLGVRVLVLPVSLLRCVVPSWLYLPPHRILVRLLHTISPSVDDKTCQTSTTREEEAGPIARYGLLSSVSDIATFPFRTVARMVLQSY
ncbi:hypothetical protein APHAL10511_007568 [Amanita phalloides]|nr:hypothetical protein APHAL10511_007568 [Amanita phalloides]